jgi:Mrp family chromosome partitioning ATPase
VLFRSAQAIQATDRPNLHVMPIGATERRVYSPFDLERFTALLKEAKDHYHYVIIDAAPALRSSDSRIIASKVDGVILVAKANVTRWEVFVELNRQLQKDGAKTVGSVLNQRQFVIPQALYKYL